MHHKVWLDQCAYYIICNTNRNGLNFCLIDSSFCTLSIISCILGALPSLIHLITSFHTSSLFCNFLYNFIPRFCAHTVYCRLISIKLPPLHPYHYRVPLQCRSKGYLHHSKFICFLVFFSTVGSSRCLARDKASAFTFLLPFFKLKLCQLCIPVLKDGFLRLQVHNRFQLF